MPVTLAVIIGLALAFVATVLTYIFIIPDRARKHLPGFLQFVHDLFNFKIMLLETIMKLLYIFCTLGSIGVGFFLLFGSSFWIGLLLLILGPLVLRGLYEFLMLYILQVQNVISINRKLR